MGILSRFKTIMASNVHALLDQPGDPVKAAEELMRSLRLDLGAVQGESNAMQAEEQRASRALAECRAELSKLAAYAEKSQQMGNYADAELFLNKGEALCPKVEELEERWRQMAGQAADLKKLEEKLRSDMDQLEARAASLKGRMATAQAQQRINGASSPLDQAEETVNQAYYEAMALKELRTGGKKDLDQEFEELEQAAKRKQADEGNERLRER